MLMDKSIVYLDPLNSSFLTLSLDIVARMACYLPLGKSTISKHLISILFKYAEIFILSPNLLQGIPECFSELSVPTLFIFFCELVNDFYSAFVTQRILFKEQTSWLFVGTQSKCKFSVFISFLRYSASLSSRIFIELRVLTEFF